MKNLPAVELNAPDIGRWRAGNSVDRAQLSFMSPDGTHIQPHFAPLSSGRTVGLTE